MRESITGERLFFWRFGVTTFDTSDLGQAVDRFLKTRDSPVPSYAVYKTFGVSDILIRCWLHHSVSPESFENEMLDEMQDIGATNPQYLLVRKIVRHQSWGNDERLPTAEEIDHLDVDLVDEYNARVSQKVYDHLSVQPPSLDAVSLSTTADQEAAIEQAKSVGAVTPLVISKKGTRFLLTFSHPRTTLSPTQRDDIDLRLRRICDQVVERFPTKNGTPHRLSVYSGFGTMGSYLITAQAPDGHFYSFSRTLLQAIYDDNLPTASEMKPTTTIYAERDASVVAESLWPRVGRELTASDISTREEDDQYELKSSFWLDVNSYLQTSKLKSFDGGPESVAKSVCAMLNRDGGTVVVGVGESDRLRGAIPRDGDKTLESTLEALQAPMTEDGKRIIFGLEVEYENAAQRVENWDVWQRKVRDQIKKFVSPDPFTTFAVRIRELRVETRFGERTLGLIDVTPPGDRSTWYYHKERFYVRFEGENAPLSGQQMDQYRQSLLARGVRSK